MAQRYHRSWGVHIRSVYRILARNKIIRRSSAEQNKIRFLRSPLSFSFKNKLSPKERELLIAGMMLYYGEGAKTGQTVDLANSDPDILKIFLTFLRRICRIDESRLRFYLYCFSDQNAIRLVDFWSNKLHLNKDNFTKPYVRKANGNLLRKMSFGVLHVRYSDKRLLEKILNLNASFVENL